MGAALLVAALGMTGLTGCSGGSSKGAAGSSSPAASSPPPSSPAASQMPASSAPPAPDLRRYYDQTLRWSGCGGDFQCARLAVPLDYTDPSGGDITLSVIRLRAEKPSARIGSLVLNPGGPGGSGVDYARAARAVTSDALRARYDIVGFDPRGVGTSTPIRCLTDAETDAFLAIDGSPDTPAEEQAWAEESRLLGQRCAQRSPKLVGHISTQEVARDVDVLRAALGDSTLHYLGASYGTYIGATYAQLFPTKAGRLVLDGALDPALPSEAVNLGQATGFEANLGDFVDDCLRKSDCPLPRPRAAALARIARLLDDSDRTPLRSESGRKVTQALVVLGIIYPLYSPSLWPQLRDSLPPAFRGDGTGLLASADAYADRRPDGRFASNSNEVGYAVNCLDHAEGSPDLARYRADATALTKAAPLFGAYLAWGSLPCATWPVQTAPKAAPITAKGAPPIVVVGTTGDPATPYAWAVSLARELSSGVLLTNVGVGHTAYQTGNACIDRAIDRFLLTGSPPADGTRCA